MKQVNWLENDAFNSLIKSEGDREMMGFAGVGMVLMLLFVVVIIGLAVWLVSNLFPRVRDSIERVEPDDPKAHLSILKSRYASGEITKAEYDEIREDLQRE